MAGPFIFIGTHQIREGQLEAFKKDCRDLVRVVEESEPQLHSFNFFFNQDESEVTVVQVHPDAQSMLTHMQVAHEHITQSSEQQLITKDVHIYGVPNETVLGMIENLSQEGTPLDVKPLHFAGFTRA